MGAKVEELARTFETKAREATAILNGLSDADWKKITAAEKWSVGVTAHHVAGSHEPIANIVKTLAAGQSIPNFTMAMLDDMNAKHAQEAAGCTKSETIALHEKGAAAAAAAVRALSDEQLGKSGAVLAGNPPMTVEQVITGILINHIDDHYGSIRKTIGR
jgi:hypothetical protein